MELFIGVLFGILGSAYLMYATRVYSPTFAVAGVLLIVYCYFVSGVLLTLFIGFAIAAAPFVLRHLQQ